jgi:RNA polymerase sigma-70 factor (ECF subfamily)
MPIEVLITESTAGNSDSFHALYGVLADRVFMFARGRTRTREDASDVLQETFIDFWDGLHSFRFRSEPELYAYLYTIARRKIARKYGRAGAQLVSATLEDIEDFIPAETSPEERVEVFDVRNAIGRLGRKYREILELRYFSGLSFGEIAENTGISENALKVRHHRAVDQLKKMMNYG